MKKIIVGLSAIMLWSFHSPVAAKTMEDAGTVSDATSIEKTKPQWYTNLEVGIRYTHFNLTDSDRPADNSDNFLGSINKLEEDQVDFPIPFITYMFCPYGGISLTYDEIKAKTITKSDGHTDGAYDISGPVLSLVCRYCNSTHFTPYAEAGVAFYLGDFDHDPAWHHAGNERRMVIENTEGYRISLGCAVSLTRNWSLDVFWRYEGIEVDDQYYLNGNLREEESIPLNNTGVGGSLTYAF